MFLLLHNKFLETNLNNVQPQCTHKSKFTCSYYYIRNSLKTICTATQEHRTWIIEGGLQRWRTKVLLPKVPVAVERGSQFWFQFADKSFLRRSQGVSSSRGDRTSTWWSVVLKIGLDECNLALLKTNTIFEIINWI